ncbi:hypothetical protein AURDEDRAFT_134800 [Auricularia subglabra TFB-10046 SS5]|nr:hypothetical protein AURDEDRAFT_134800 [Auricularia subglabra TFB-10046 SS5]
MDTARFFGGAYTPPGETRTTTKKTIVIQGACNIECCAYPETDDELDYICKMAKQYSRTWRNPFGTAAWVHLILIRCQPFNDGNGRITRIVASLPLLVHGFPPMTVLPAQRPDYHEALRAAANGEYRPLIECIIKGIQNTMKAVQCV